MLKSILTRILPFVATALLCVVGILLGNWQTRRALEKEEMATVIQEQMRQPALNIHTQVEFAQLRAFHKVKLKGQFVHNWPLYLDNRPLYGVAGFYVLMPFKMLGSEQAILIARGWLQRDVADRTKIPLLLTDESVIEIEGVVRDQLDRTMQLGKAPALKAGAIVQSVLLDDLRQQSGIKFADKIVEQTSDSGDGLIRDWPKPSAGADKHRAYAFQWYGLALMAAIFFVVTGIRRGKSRK
ncbi:SURF1 family protein [Undibacterium flavidum]|uniref:SURF1-like protein n=1 Tax=Undibacterium flavidum TaxID=2762297 RepID=A0ABR6YAX6_9BURK|nr:SURF1 family protein [Undibacterium flavidum]MBC3873711.1 SURF1 family protein [Undibacterium flavidum]